MRISDWSSDVCSSDLTERRCTAFSGALSVARVVSVDVSVYGVQNAHGGLYGAHYVRLAGSVSNLLDPAALDGRGLGRRVGDLDLHADEAPAVADRKSVV